MAVRATPGRYDGCPHRAGGIELIADEDHLEPKFNQANRTANLAVNAATMTIKTYCVCAGNYETNGGWTTTETEPDLIAYLNSLKGKPPSSWPNYAYDLTRRRTFGPGQDGVDRAGKLVWGQSCKGKRHFDCVGFISYCYWKASGVDWQLDISAWRRPGAGPSKTVYHLAKKDENNLPIPERPPALEDGDILIKEDHHIAYASANGEIIEAQDTHLGVCITRGFTLAAPGKWTHLVRLGDARSATELKWPMGCWRVWDGSTWYYYLGPDSVAMSSKTPPFDTRKPPAKAHNTGTWVYGPPTTLVITWKQVVGAPKPCEETFRNAREGCDQMNANSNLYSPLVATRMSDSA